MYCNEDGGPSLGPCNPTSRMYSILGTMMSLVLTLELHLKLRALGGDQGLPFPSLPFRVSTPSLKAISLRLISSRTLHLF